MTLGDPGQLTISDWNTICTSHDSDTLQQLFYPNDNNQRNPDLFPEYTSSQYDTVFTCAQSEKKTGYRNPAEIITSIRTYGATCRSMLHHLIGWLGASISVDKKVSVKPSLHHSWRVLWQKANPDRNEGECEVWALELQTLVLDHVIENHVLFTSSSLRPLLAPDTLDKDHYDKRFQYSIWHDLLVLVREKISPLTFKHAAVASYVATMFSPFDVALIESLALDTANQVRDHTITSVLPHLATPGSQLQLREHFESAITNWIIDISVKRLKRCKDMQIGLTDDSTINDLKRESDQLKIIIQTLSKVSKKELLDFSQHTKTSIAKTQEQATSVPARPRSSNAESSDSSPPSHQPLQKASSAKRELSPQLPRNPVTFARDQQHTVSILQASSTPSCGMIFTQKSPTPPAPSVPPPKKLQHRLNPRIADNHKTKTRKITPQKRKSN